MSAIDRTTIKIIVRENPNEEGGFAIIAGDGTDLTEHFAVTKLVVTAEPQQLTKALIECYAEVEVEASDVEIRKFNRD